MSLSLFIDQMSHLIINLTYINNIRDLNRELQNLPPEINILNFSTNVREKYHLSYLSGHKIHRLILRPLSRYVTDVELRYFSGCLIDKIEINANNLTGDGLKYLSGCSNIKIFNGIKITDDKLKYLSHADSIILINCPNITNRGLKYFSNCSKFRIINCQNTTIHGIKFMAHLSEIDLGSYRFAVHEYRYFANATTIILTKYTIMKDVITRYISMINNIYLMVGNVNSSSVFRSLVKVENIHFVNCRPFSLCYVHLVNVRSIHIYGYNQVTNFGTDYLKKQGIKIMHYEEYYPKYFKMY